MKALQTPKKDHHINNRRSKSVSEHNKKIITKKCSDPAPEFSPGDDVAFESPEDSFEHYQQSEISVDHQLDESTESFLALDPLLPVSLQESIDSSDLTPSSASTVTKHMTGDNSAAHIISVETDNSSDRSAISSAETDMLVNHLRQARTQVINSTGSDLLYRKLADKLLDVVYEDLMGHPYANDRLEKLFAMKFRTLLLSFLPLFLCVMVYFFCSREQSSYSGPSPT